MTDSQRSSEDGKSKSPFVLPATTAAYPLDPEERREIEDFLAELRLERGRAESRPSDGPKRG